MKKFLRAFALMLMLILACPAQAATPTPPPIAIAPQVETPPAQIQQVLDIAYNEWETLAGQTLSNCNKFTEWRGKGVKFGWCAGYITWCMLEAGIPQQEIEPIINLAKKYDDGVWRTSGVYHVMEASVGKVMRGYMAMGRTTMVPQPGFLLVYGCSYNRTIHLALVYDVELLENGLYRITTLEGNMANRVKMYIRDYDLNVQVNTNNKKSTNLFEVPADERVIPESDHVDYSIPVAKPSDSANGKYPYYVLRFLMPWVPGDPALGEMEAAATPAPTAEPTAAPVAAPTAEPTLEPAAQAAAEPQMEATAAPAAETLAPEATPAPEATADPTPDVPGRPAFPCQGKEGKCTFVTYSADDHFCRSCDWNDNGIEDGKE